VKENPRIKYTIKVKGKPMTGEISLGDFMDVKGWKALGNRLSDQILTGIKEIDASESRLLPKTDPTSPAVQVDLFGAPDLEEDDIQDTIDPGSEEVKPTEKKTYKPGDTLDFDV
jgi:hypothetical protein